MREERKDYNEEACENVPLLAENNQVSIAYNFDVKYSKKLDHLAKQNFRTSTIIKFIGLLSEICLLKLGRGQPSGLLLHPKVRECNELQPHLGRYWKQQPLTLSGHNGCKQTK